MGPSRNTGRGLLALAAASLLAACTTTTPVNTWVPAHCHAAATPFRSYDIAFEQVPGFKEPIMRDGLNAALQRRGLTPVTEGDDADVTMHLRITLIQRGGALAEPRGADPGMRGGEDDLGMAQDTRAEDTLSTQSASNDLSRFVAHADLELIDNRDQRMIWKGGMDRSHAISGGVVFHDDRARALIAAALDNALAGLDRPCD